MDLAICVPLGSTLQLTKTRSAESLAAFKAIVDTSVSFHDKDHGLLWLRVVGEYARKQEDYQPCGKDNTGCFTETIKFLTLGSRWTWEEIGGSQRGGIGSTVVGIVLEFLKTRSVFMIGIKIIIITFRFVAPMERLTRTRVSWNTSRADDTGRSLRSKPTL